MQRVLHSGGRYGQQAAENRKGGGMDLVSRLVVSLKQRIGRHVSVLDYGAGNGSLGRALRDTFKNVTVTDYDPFHVDHAEKPEPGLHDMLVCLDVMEHVEEACVGNTLRYMADRVRYGALFVISLQDALKVLPDGRNAHVTVKNAKWWKNRLSRYFKVCEMTDYGHTGVFLCEALEAEQSLQQEAA